METYADFSLRCGSDRSLANRRSKCSNRLIRAARVLA
jgi:hypothetical protein